MAPKPAQPNGSTDWQEPIGASVSVDREPGETPQQFARRYRQAVREQRQADSPFYDRRLDEFINSDPANLKIIWGDCLNVLRALKPESIQLIVTSPPYYNARAYSQWIDLHAYISEMQSVIDECYRVLDNHRIIVFNVGDIFDNDNRQTRASWGKRRIPLGAYFTRIFEQAGFTFVDDFIWDKGEVQSQRHKSGDRPYPLYQYPVNCYEHLLVFAKHELDHTPYPCPVCGSLDVNVNGYASPGIKTWECMNRACPERSVGDRGKRFSARTQIMTDLQSERNRVDPDLLRMWRRDVVQFPPVIKVNSKGVNKLGHTAPFPREIPRYAVQVFSGVGETVLDPFAGSFTTAIEATLAGRNGVGVEINKESFREAVTANVGKSIGGLMHDWRECDHEA